MNKSINQQALINAIWQAFPEGDRHQLDRLFNNDAIWKTVLRFMATNDDAKGFQLALNYLELQIVRPTKPTRPGMAPDPTSTASLVLQRIKAANDWMHSSNFSKEEKKGINQLIQRKHLVSRPTGTGRIKEYGLPEWLAQAERRIA